MKKLLALCLLLTGCAGWGSGLKPAHDIGRGLCAVLNSGSTTDALAATADLQKTIVEFQARTAVERGASQATIDSLVRSTAVMADALRENAAEIGKLAGEGKASDALPPCPVVPSSPDGPLGAAPLP